MRIDVHTHAWSSSYLARLDGYLADEPCYRLSAAAYRNIGADLTDKDLEARFAGTDAAGVELEVLSAAPMVAHFTDRDHAVSAARHANDDYAQAATRWPDRFRFFATLPLPHIDAALAELDRALALPGALGVTLTTTVLGTSLSDPALDPLCAELDRRGGTLYIHPEGADAYTRLIRDSHITWMVGAPVEDTLAATHLIIRDTPRRFPNMKIVLSHLGGALPMLPPRMDDHVPWEQPDIPEMPTVAVRRMWYDTVSHKHPPALRAAVESFGADRIVLGTDFPYQSGEKYQDAIRYVTESGLAQDDAAGILDRNAQALLGL